MTKKVGLEFALERVRVILIFLLVNTVHLRLRYSKGKLATLLSRITF